MEEKASGRKDIIFLFFLSFLVLNIKKISFNNQKYLIILFSAISVFSHTGFIFLLPAFLIIFLFSNKNKNPKILLKEILIILLSYLIFFLIIINNKIISPENINLICNSISDYVRNDCAKTGYISTLSWSLKYNLYLKENLWMTESYNFFYLIAFVLSFFPLLFTLHYSKFLNYKKISVLFFFTLFFLSSIPLYYLGVDYGRYMHLTYLSTVIIYSVAIKNKILITSFPKNFNLINLKMKFPIILLIIFLYGFTFTIPHCCNNNFKFNYSNLIMKINEQLN